MKKRNQNQKALNTIDKIGKNIETVAKNSERTNEKIDQLVSINKSKLPVILTIIGLALSAIGLHFTFLDFSKEAANESTQYTIYLSSEYTKLKAFAETDIIATLDFDAASISVSAYLDSVKKGDTLEMTRTNQTVWHKKVYFEEIGVYKVIVTATTPDGDIIESSIEIEVI